MKDYILNKHFILCGFLQKQAGPLRAWKRRWFSYEQNQNQLFYFRSPKDVAPLGRIRLSGATFTCPLNAESGTFHIQTPERTFILKVGTPGRSGSGLVIFR
uniref:PH domain-containing protein n=1 Tax=Xiphophorus couchianus TaxID=32473 RepID=A0A3B5L9T3_9TELE